MGFAIIIDSAVYCILLLFIKIIELLFWLKSVG